MAEYTQHKARIFDLKLRPGVFNFHFLPSWTCLRRKAYIDNSTHHSWKHIQNLGMDKERHHTKSGHRPLGGGGYKYPPPTAFPNNRSALGPNLHSYQCLLLAHFDRWPAILVAQKAGVRRTPFSTGTPGLSHLQPPRTCPCQVVRHSWTSIQSHSFIYFFRVIIYTKSHGTPYCLLYDVAHGRR